MERMRPVREPTGRPVDALGRREFLAVAAAGLTLPFLRRPPSPRGASPVDAVVPLRAFIRERMEAAKVPGLAACVVVEGRIVWSRGYGWANVAKRVPVTPDTDFMLASISKTVIATAAMQCVEDGLLDLDADVDTVLPFPVRNPGHPSVPVTLRRLLTHTASLRDNWGIWDHFYSQGDSPVPLGGFLRRYLAPQGDLYDAARNFDPWRPGVRYRYSNIGAALAGFLVEAASGIPFDVWCEDRIFTPLAMPRTSWHLLGLERANVAMPYAFRNGAFIPYGQYGYPDYPDGALRSTARELAHHLLSFMRQGAFRGTRVLHAATVQEMQRTQFPDVVKGQGLIWYTAHRGGRRLLGHNGGDSGVATQMFFRPDDDVGVITLANGDWRRSHGGWPLVQIMDRLFDEAPHLAGRGSDRPQVAGAGVGGS
jgi:CubicO group peptidase (beta-lactamase class C family)